MKNFVVATSLLFMCGFGLAQNPEISLSTCTSIETPLARLACYDNLAGRTNTNPQTSATGSLSANWAVNIDTNPIDDSQSVVISTDAVEGRSDYGRAPALVLRCSSGETDFYIVWDDYIGSDEDAYVTSRVGDEQANRRLWGLSTDSTATFYPGNQAGLVNHIMEIMNADRYVAQITPYNSSPVTAVFDVSGLTEVIKPLRDTCSW